MSIGGPEIVAGLAIAGLSLFWLWTLHHCLDNPRLSRNEQFYWIALMAITHVLGALSYWLNRDRTERSPALSQR